MVLRDGPRRQTPHWCRPKRTARSASMRIILDLGCGTGRFAEGLVQRFSARVVGVDRAPDYPRVTFFPARRPMMESRLPTARHICNTFEAVGLHQVVFELVIQRVALN